ncbi:MAG TPA: hypothetical protein PLY93_01085 [Turneriella sp.]|nr:hypothetical protein [Turneriella sp.]
MKLLKTLAVCVVAASFIACGSGNVRFPDKTTKIDLKNKSVLVVVEDNASSDTKVSLAFKGAAAEKVGSKKVLPTIPDSVKGVTKIYTNFGLQDKGVVDPQNLKALAIDEILKLSAKLGKFDTIVFVSAEKGSGMAVPQTTGVEFYASVYDIAGKKVLAAVSDSASLVTTGLLAQMPLKARDIVTVLLEGQAD